MWHPVRAAVDVYYDIMDNKSDQRVNNWFLMSSPIPTLCIVLAYTYFVKVLGPKLMKDRKPFDLKNVLLAYNFAQVIFSLLLFNEYMVAWKDYSLVCQPVDYSNNPSAVRIAHACWWYYISKFTEFFDTIFFVLRKKNNNISTLHVIHHGIMPMSCWIGVKFTAGGHFTFFVLLNTFVHIVMYAYYLLAALGPQMQKYLWWKKYLTTLQMVQFVLITVHSFQILVVDCGYSKGLTYYIACHSVMFYFLFSDFYKQTYSKNKAGEKLVNETNSTIKNPLATVCFPTQSSLYESSNKVKDIPRTYTSKSNATLRNRHV